MRQPLGLTITRRRLLAGAASAGALAGAGCGTPSIFGRRDGGGAAVEDAAQVANLFTSDRVKLQHLLRRAAFGATPADLARYKGWPLNDVVDDLLNYAAVDDSDLESRLQANAYDFTKPADMIAWWLARMVYTRRPLLERMTFFWHGILTSAFSKLNNQLSFLMIIQNQFLRENALGPYGVTLKGISRDPAMMIWLDTRSNTKAHPNENYARELMELFSLGIGNYTENDVREAARAFTGWSLAPQKGFVFRPTQHDDGVKTVLGATGAWDGDDVVDIIVRQPAAANYVATRLWSYFAYPNPEPEVIAPVAAALRASGFTIRDGLRAVLTSPAFYSSKAYRAHVRAPVDYVVWLARLLNLGGDGRLLVRVSHMLGQDLFNPPNVAGWPGGAAWLGTSLWFARVNVAAAAVNGVQLPDAKVPPADVTALVGSVHATAHTAVDAVVDLLADGNVSKEMRAELVAYASDGGWTSLPLTEREIRLRGLAIILLASPVGQLA